MASELAGGWPEDTLGPAEQYLYEGDRVKVGLFDCPAAHDSFAVTETTTNSVFAFATKPVWIRRRTRDYQYVGRGSILFHAAGSTIERKREQTSHDLAYWFAIQEDVFKEALRTHRLGDQFPLAAISPEAGVQLKIATAIRQVQRDDAEAFGVESTALSILDEMCGSMHDYGRTTPECVTRPSARARAKRLIDKAKAYIDANIAEEISLDGVAREVGLSAYYLCRLFKSTCGITINEYKIQQRLTTVVHEIAQGDGRDLARLALDSGFSSHSHLTRTFSRRFGMPPSAMRRLSGKRELAPAS